MDMKYILFRQPAYILAKLEDGMRVSDVRSPVHCTYTHVWKVIQLFVREGFVNVDELTKDIHRRKYNLTNKGKKIQYHIRELMEVL